MLLLIACWISLALWPAFISLISAFLAGRWWVITPGRTTAGLRRAWSIWALLIALWQRWLDWLNWLIANRAPPRLWPAAMCDPQPAMAQLPYRLYSLSCCLRQ
jgi:hypothetical protein